MRLLLSLSALLLALGGCATTGPANLDTISATLALPGRSAEDRARDARDQPAQVLALAGIRPGMVVADIFGGGGYYSEILARLVGPEGQVLLVNNGPYDAYSRKGLDQRRLPERMPNVRYSVMPNDALQLGEARLDAAVMVMAYHDLYHTAPADGWPAVDAQQFIGQIVRALKPGASLLIVEHAARDGSGKADAQTLHRIDEAFAIADFKAHGLQFAGSIAALRNPADDRSLGVFDPAIRGKTDRFVHLYRKP